MRTSSLILATLSSIKGHKPSDSGSFEVFNAVTIKDCQQAAFWTSHYKLWQRDEAQKPAVYRFWITLWLHDYVDNLSNAENSVLQLLPTLPQALLGMSSHGQVQTVSRSTEIEAPQNHLCSHNKDCKFCAASVSRYAIAEILRPCITEGTWIST